MARERAAVPDYVGAMVRRSPPEQCPVVPGSRPVVAFGDPTRAEVATLGINPSVHEFVEDGRLLAGDLRRLATLDALGAVDCSELTVEQVAAVVADCAAYFQQRPYRRWFDPLDKLLRAGTDASYYDGSACHLDLVQWATDPTWSKLPGDVQQALLDDGVPHLRAQLSRENVRLVVLNGRQVLTQAEALGLADLTEVGRLPVGATTCRLYTGTGGGVRWLGWSTNLQSSWGVSAAFKQQLGAWLAEVSTTSEDAMDHELTEGGHLPQGLRVQGKAELVEVLHSWLEISPAATIGDIGAFGGKPWIWIDVDGWTVALNADTKRAAVEAVVRDHRHHPNRLRRLSPRPSGPRGSRCGPRTYVVGFGSLRRLHPRRRPRSGPAVLSARRPGATMNRTVDMRRSLRRPGGRDGRSHGTDHRDLKGHRSRVHRAPGKGWMACLCGRSARRGPTATIGRTHRCGCRAGAHRRDGPFVDR